MNSSRVPPPLCQALLLALLSVIFTGCASTPPSSTPPSSTAHPVAPPIASSTDTRPPETQSPGGTPATTDRGITIAAQTDSTTSASDDTATAVPTTDLWHRLRQGFAMPTLDNDLVRSRERWYVSQPDYIERMSTRGSRYLYFIVEELERRGMPTELALLPFVESAFNPTAISSARAEGMWQFMPATGRTYQLTQNIFRDDRRDVLESTRAALDYLQRLHTMFDDWHLALAAYNWGEGNVQRAIKRNAARGLPTNYDSLSMPIETRHYVPKLQALKNIVTQPEAFNLSLIELPNHPYFLSVPIQRDIDVAVAAKLAGLSLSDFHTLNPSQKKPVILAAGTPQILLPYDNASRFEANLARYKGQLASWTAWQVPHTMKTREAAKLVGMTEAELRSINSIPPRMLVRAGSTLLVERAGSRRHDDVPEALAETASMHLTPDLPPLRRVTVHAGKGDSVASLAKRYRVRAGQIAQWNRVSATASLPRGKTVVLWLPASAIASTKVKPMLLATHASAEKTPMSKHLSAGSASARPQRTAIRTTASARKAASNGTATRKPSMRDRPPTAKPGDKTSTRKVANSTRAPHS